MRPWVKVLVTWLFVVARHKMVWLMIGGALGTLARYGVSKGIGSQSWADGFPWGTLVVNVTGSFLLGFLAILFLERLPPEYADWYLLFGTGFCGAYTTFSTFEWETFKLVRDGSWLLAGANVASSIVLGFIGLVLGIVAASALFPRQ